MAVIGIFTHRVGNHCAPSLRSMIDRSECLRACLRDDLMMESEHRSSPANMQNAS